MSFLLQALLALALQGAVDRTPPPAPVLFTDRTLMISFKPPDGLRDVTAYEKAAIQSKAAATGRATMNLLLALRSGPDDTLPEWNSVSIESIPRERLGNISERAACQTFARWVAAGGIETAESSDAQIGRFHFSVSFFQVKEGPVTRRAAVYTTIRKGQLLSFAFSANSAELLDRIRDSMRSLVSLEGQ